MRQGLRNIANGHTPTASGAFCIAHRTRCLRPCIIQIGDLTIEIAATEIRNHRRRIILKKHAPQPGLMREARDTLDHLAVEALVEAENQRDVFCFSPYHTGRKKKTAVPSLAL
jgi:hypothetical protein